MKLYIGNLPYDLTDNELLELLSEFGEVVSANIIRDKADNSSKGFGFVEMKSAVDAEAAITALNGTEVKGRQIKVNEARPKQEGSGGGGGGGRSGGGNRRGGGGGGRRW
jgi:cold-inducible RNA-binding protein